MGKFCSQCGAPLNIETKFCGGCGKAVGTTRETGGEHPGVISVNKVKKSPKKGVAVVLLLTLLLGGGVYFLFRFLSAKEEPLALHRVSGQPYPGRALTLHGEDFGEVFRAETQVTIGGIFAPILRFEGGEVTVLVPETLSPGVHEVVFEDPLAGKKVLEVEFIAQEKQVLLRGTLSPFEDNFLEGEGFRLIVPEGAVAEETTILLSRYEVPAREENPFIAVREEFEITLENGDHVFFQSPVFFGLDVVDEEEAMQSAYQIFDEFQGLWVRTEAIYVEEEGKVYFSTTHFSSFRRFVSVMYQGTKKMVGEQVEKEKEKIEYVYNQAKSVKNAVVKLTEETYVAVKDALVEEFVAVKDEHENFVVYYRVADAKVDPTIPSLAHEMAAAFSTAHEEYLELFGEEGVPKTTRGKILSESGTEERVADPICVYIDPRYSGAVAKTATTGNIIMPSTYREGDMAAVAAHELFHVVQYHQLGVKQLYMGTTGLKSLVDNTFTGNRTEVYRFFANNMWFFEATAEYAGRFIGTKVGYDAPIHPSIDASKPYYAYNGYHDYGVSSFLAYLFDTRQPEVADPALAFKEMWEKVTQNYSMASSINVSFDGYVHRVHKESAEAAYANFFREAFTRRYMPPVHQIAGGQVDVMTLKNRIQRNTVTIQNGGVAVLRYNMTPTYVLMGDSTVSQSFYVDTEPSTLPGDVYLLEGLDMEHRVMEEPHVGRVNDGSGKFPRLLVPYVKGETKGLVAVFHHLGAEVLEAKIQLSATDLVFDNEKKILEKVKNTTLSKEDLLSFTPTLPVLGPSETPFHGVVLLNNNEDYKTEIPKVEHGKRFQVAPPMKELLTENLLVNVKIYQGEVLVHEYQLGEEKLSVRIQGGKDVAVDVTKEALPYGHQFEAVASMEGNFTFSWDFGNGRVEEANEERTSRVASEYSAFGTYEAKVTLYDATGKEVAKDQVTLRVQEEAEKVPSGKGMEGTWVNYGIYYGGGDMETLSIDVTLSIQGGSFTMTRAGGGADPWSGGGAVRAYTDASGNPAFKLEPNTGNSMDDYNFALYFGMERDGMFLDYSEEQDELTVGTTGARLYFKRRD